MVMKDWQGKELISTADPMIIKTILHSNFCDWEIGRVRRSAFEPFLGQGVFTTDGEMWEKSRALLKPVFTRKSIENLAQYMSPHFGRLVQVMDGSGLSSNRWTEAGDLHNYFLCYAMDISMDFVFGRSMGSLSRLLRTGVVGEVKNDSSADAKLEAFQKAFDDAYDGMTIRGRLGGFYWLYSTLKFRKACSICKKFVASYVEKSLSPIREQEKLSNGRGNCLEELSKATKDQTIINATLLQLLLASRNTTGTTLAFVIGCLARRPDVFNRLRGEILHHFGSEDSDIEISLSGLKATKYLQAVLNETLRLYPIIPYNIRTAVRDTVLPAGGGPDGSEPLAVRKGTKVGYVVYVMHRRPDIWGPDAADWRPERWEGRKTGSEYLPFNSGPRVCIGQELAMFELGYTLVRLLQRYEGLRLAEGTDPVLRKGVRLGIFPKEVIVQFQRAK